jgi:hypothetical protein
MESKRIFFVAVSWNYSFAKTPLLQAFNDKVKKTHTNYIFIKKNSKYYYYYHTYKQEAIMIMSDCERLAEEKLLISFPEKSVMHKMLSKMKSCYFNRLNQTKILIFKALFMRILKENIILKFNNNNK